MNIQKQCKKISQDTYQFPHWSTIANTYAEAVLLVLEDIKSSRPFYNYREGNISEHTLRETERKQVGIKQATHNGIVTINVQLGEKYKGKSVEEVRKLFEVNEFGLGAYEIGCILLTEPDILNDNSLWIDCAGDEFDAPAAAVRFDHAPYFDFSVGRVGFGTYWCGHAYGHYGSVSAFVPQSIEFRNLDA